MKRSLTYTRIPREGGFILATVLVFLLVLTLTAFFAAALTRTDVQVVNNLQNEKEALYAAEAGINEALFRLGTRGGSNVTINPGPGTFDASVYTRYRASCPGGALSANSSPYGLDACDAFSNIAVLFNSTAPSVSGSNVEVPTLQRAAYPVTYSTGNSGSSTNLKIEWDRCTAADVGVRYGCTAVDQIRQRTQPGCSNTRNIVKITSTGEVRRNDGSVVASRTVKVRAVDFADTSPGNPLGSLLTSNFGCPGITMNGGASITAEGSIQMNAGAPPTFGGSPPASCNSSESTSGVNNNTITACTDSSLTNCSIDVSGSRVDGSPTYSPRPQTDQPTIVDPFGNVNPPSLPAGPVPSPLPANYKSPTGRASDGSPAVCPGTASNPQPCSPATGTTLYPGIYWGGLQLSNSVTLAPGLYVMAGGGLNVGGGSPTITGNGVTIVNTYDPLCSTAACNYGPVNALGTGNATVTLIAPTTDPTTNPPTGPDNYGLVGTDMKGFLIYQNRTDSAGQLPNPPINTNPTPTCGNPTPLGCINLQGGTNGLYTLDGVIYAWGAPAELQGHANEVMNTSLIVGSLALNGSSNITLGHPSTTPGSVTCGGSSYTAIAWQDF